jgi:hypothetical protein
MWIASSRATFPAQHPPPLVITEALDVMFSHKPWERPPLTDAYFY